MLNMYMKILLLSVIAWGLASLFVNEEKDPDRLVYFVKCWGLLNALALVAWAIYLIIVN